MQGLGYGMNEIQYGTMIANAAPVSPWVTVVFGIILLGLIACLAFEEQLHAKKSVIAGGFAIVSLFLAASMGLLPFQKVVIGSDPLVDHESLAGERLERDGELTHVEIPAVHADGESEGTGGAVAADEEPLVPVHVDGHRIGMPVYIPAIDWGVIAIIVGSSLFVDVTSKSGLFTWIAIKVTKFSGGDPLALLILYGLMTVVFSAVLNNVTAMIIVGSLTAVSLEKLGRNDKLLGFLLVEGLLTNVGGLLTLISSVPNIIVGTAANISFIQFFYVSAPYVTVATLLTLALAAWRFQIHRLRGADEKETARQLVSGFDEKDGIESWGVFWFGAAMLVLFIATIATTSVLPVISDLEMGFVALAFAGAMLLLHRHDVEKFYRALDWDLLGFFMGLFVVIHVMEHARVLDAIGSVLGAVMGWEESRGTSAVLVSSSVVSSVTDNIPLSAMLAKILGGMPDVAVQTADTQASRYWWAVIFGANLGGNITPIGSASTLVAATIIHRHKLPLSFASFVKLAAPFAVLQIVIAVLYVLFVVP